MEPMTTQPETKTPGQKMSDYIKSGTVSPNPSASEKMTMEERAAIMELGVNHCPRGKNVLAASPDKEKIAELSEAMERIKQRAGGVPNSEDEHDHVHVLWTMADAALAEVGRQEQVSKEVMPHATGLRPGPCESPQFDPTGKASQVSTGEKP